MSRLLVTVLIILLASCGGLYLLAGLDTEKPLTRVEKVVPSDKLAK